MNINIRTRGLKLRAPYRERIERYVERALHRERKVIVNAALYLTPARGNEATAGYTCRLVLAGRPIGRIVVTANGPRLGVAVRQAMRRGRTLVRERLKRRFVTKRAARARQALAAA